MNLWQAVQDEYDKSPLLMWALIVTSFLYLIGTPGAIRDKKHYEELEKRAEEFSKPDQDKE